MASLKQIHSDIALRVHQPGLAGEGDALITSVAGLPISVRTADCYPILLADARKRIVAAVHAGWRGTVAQIARKTIEQMESDPKDVFAAVGPGIGLCCYFVGEDVARLFDLEHAGHIDLADANRAQLTAAGVPPAQIEVAGECTFCHPERYYSFRREKHETGRMISFIALRS